MEVDLRKFMKRFGDKEKIKFYSNRTDFKVTLMNENYNREVENTGDKPAIKSSDKIIGYLKVNDYITTNIAIDILELKSKSWARDILNKMVKDNILIAEGANRNRKYRLNKNN